MEENDNIKEVVAENDEKEVTINDEKYKKLKVNLDTFNEDDVETDEDLEIRNILISVTKNFEEKHEDEEWPPIIVFTLERLNEYQRDVLRDLGFEETDRGFVITFEEGKEIVVAEP